MTATEAIVPAHRMWDNPFVRPADVVPDVVLAAGEKVVDADDAVYNGGDTTRDTTGGSVYNPGTTSGSVYSEDSADYVDPAKSYTPRGGGSDRGSGSERGSERSGRQRQAVRFKPAAKKVAALSPDPVKNAPYFGRGEPPSWSPGAAKVG